MGYFIVGNYMNQFYFVKDSSDNSVQLITSEEYDDLIHNGVPIGKIEAPSRRIEEDRYVAGGAKFLYSLKNDDTCVKGGKPNARLRYKVSYGIVTGEFLAMYKYNTLVGADCRNMCFSVKKGEHACWHDDNPEKLCAYAISVECIVSGGVVNNAEAPKIHVGRDVKNQFPFEHWHSYSICAPSLFIEYVLQLCRRGSDNILRYAISDDAIAKMCGYTKRSMEATSGVPFSSCYVKVGGTEE